MERVTVGAVGEPGQRTFYLQAREQDRLVSLKLEKQQVGALGQLLTELLSDLPAPGSFDPGVELEEPVLAEWPVGTMQIGYDADTDRVVLIAEEVTLAGDGDDEADAGAIGRMVITRAQAAILAARSESLVSSGRPPCPLCGFPLDPAGHSCPKTNGHGPPRL